MVGGVAPSVAAATFPCFVVARNRAKHIAASSLAAASTLTFVLMAGPVATASLNQGPANVKSAPGARALGMEDRIGSLETGKRADIVVVDVRAARMTPLYDPVSHLVYAAKGADVRHVVVEGRVIMRDRAVLTLDEAAIEARAAALAARVTASLRK